MITRALALFALLATQNAIAAEQDLTGYVHAENSVKLPFDPMYCDENGNQNVDLLEIRPDNVCLIEGQNELFSQKPISSFGLSKGQLILTLDDGPNPSVTKPILDLLAEYNIKATFFVIGKQVPSNASLIKDMIDRGHIVANHTYSHDIPNITATTIKNEVLKTHTAITNAYGKSDLPFRLVFRAPGLAWSAPKAVALNNDSTTRQYIGPIHANLGTDAPRADWSCWSKGVSSQTCADWYYQDIMNTGRGNILTHDIYYKKGKGNTAEMLRILLKRLDKEGGGISNKSGSGVWTFVNLGDLQALDQFEANATPLTPKTPVNQKPAPQPQTPPASKPQTPAVSGPFKNGNVFVRTEYLVQIGALTDDSKIPTTAGDFVKTGDITQITDLGKMVVVGQNTFKKVQIKKTKPGFETLEGLVVYISAKAF